MLRIGHTASVVRGVWLWTSETPCAVAQSSYPGIQTSTAAPGTSLRAIVVVNCRLNASVVLDGNAIADAVGVGNG